MTTGSGIETAIRFCVVNLKHALQKGPEHLDAMRAAAKEQTVQAMTPVIEDLLAGKRLARGRTLDALKAFATWIASEPDAAQLVDRLDAQLKEYNQLAAAFRELRRVVSSIWQLDDSVCLHSLGDLCSTFQVSWNEINKAAMEAGVEPVLRLNQHGYYDEHAFRAIRDVLGRKERADRDA